MAFKLDAKIPAGALAEKWSNHKAAIKVVSPANKRKLDIIIVGTGLGGASAAASLGELGYNVKIFCIQDSPRRAHSIAAQAVSTLRRTTRTTTTRYTACSTIRSRAATTVHAKPTYTAWRRFPTSSSTSAWPRAYLSHANTAACWPTARSAAHRYRARSMPRPDGPAAPAGRLFGTQQGDRSRHGEKLSAP